MIYLDNASATFPKPREVCRAVSYFMKNCCVNPCKSGYALSRTAGEKIESARSNISQFFGINDPRRLVFTSNDTLSLNMAVQGLLKPGDHAVTTVYEHNSVTRPLARLSKTGVQVTVLDGNLKGEISLGQLKRAIKPTTRLVIVSAAGNVLGNILPILEIGSICRQYEIALLVDGAQAAGIIPIDVEKMNIDLLTFSGHKGLLGPMGTGGLYIGERAKVEDIIQGETGTLSESLEQPEALPYRYESGTINAAGIWGLSAGSDFIRKKKINKMKKQADELVKILIEGLSDIPGINILGKDIGERIPIVSFNVKNKKAEEVSKLLDEKYEIETGGGLHGAGLFHRMAGTIEQGTVRVSPGFFNTKEEVLKLVKAVEEIAR